MNWPVAARGELDGRRHRHSEPCGQQPQVVAVGGPQRVAEMMADLELRGHTAHLPSTDHTHAGQLLGRISTPGVLPKVLPAIAMPVKDDSMQINLSVSGVDQDQPSRQARHGPQVRLEPQAG